MTSVSTYPHFRVRDTYGGIDSASSAVFGSKGLCNSSSFDLLFISSTSGTFSLRVELASRVHRTADQPCPFYIRGVDLQSIKPGELTQDVRLVILLVHVIDSCHLFNPLGLKMSRSEPLSIMRPLRFEGRL
jgi:hypothetical protein